MEYVLDWISNIAVTNRCRVKKKIPARTAPVFNVHQPVLWFTKHGLWPPVRETVFH